MWFAFKIFDLWCREQPIFAKVAKDWPLWFAFKIFDLWCREQQHSRLGGSSLRCDLLSKFSIFDVVNNYPAYFGGIGCVVICFQNFRSLMSWTTKKNYYATKISCDLLSKFSIFDVVNNLLKNSFLSWKVVICFQNFRSLMSWTTFFSRVKNTFELWFAFKIFDLWCREQPLLHWNKQQTSCDLLSKFSIFDVVNNRGGDSY